MLSILIGVIAGLFALLRYQAVKKNSAESLLANVDMKTKLVAEDEKAAGIKTRLAEEELKRKTILASQRTDGQPPASIDDLTKFLNDKDEK